MEKLSDILCGIPNDKWINYKFELQIGVGKMAWQEILIYSQNVIGCLEFLMGHLGFCHNQTYELSGIFNKNEHRVYNKMHTDKWY